MARATFVLIGINVAAFLLEVFTGSGGLSTTGSTVFADGALCGNAIGDGGICAAQRDRRDPDRRRRVVADLHRPASCTAT